MRARFLFLILFAPFCVSVSVAQKASELPPLELPQTPVAERAGSDAKDENLRGKVKRIVEESEYLPDSDEPKGRPRQKDSEIFYNERGDLVKAQYFTGGPATIAYGFIDGARASIRRDDPDPARANIPRPPAVLETKPVPKRDPRYTFKFTYKYDDKGRLIEEMVFDNRGEQWSHATYSYTGDKTVERLSYIQNQNGQDETKPGAEKVGEKELITLDEKGNIFFNVDTSFNWQKKGVPDYREQRYLAFDKQGNWTKMTLKVQTRKYDGTPLEYNYVKYRTIEYYP